VTHTVTASLIDIPHFIPPILILLSMKWGKRKNEQIFLFASVDDYSESILVGVNNYRNTVILGTFL